MRARGEIGVEAAEVPARQSGVGDSKNGQERDCRYQKKNCVCRYQALPLMLIMDQPVQMVATEFFFSSSNIALFFHFLELPNLVHRTYHKREQLQTINETSEKKRKYCARVKVVL